MHTQILFTAGFLAADAFRRDTGINMTLVTRVFHAFRIAHATRKHYIS